jgi:hypothetical protein
MVRVGVIPAATILLMGLSLSACSGTSSNFDPTDWITGEFFDKPKLPGERKAVFPEGVPGVPQGVPPELMKGAQQASVDTAPATEPEPAPAAKPAPKPQAAKPAPKPRTASAPPQPAPVRTAPTQATSQPNAAWPDPNTVQAPRPAQRAAPAPAQPANSQANWPAPDPNSFSH